MSTQEARIAALNRHHERQAIFSQSTELVTLTARDPGDDGQEITWPVTVKNMAGLYDVRARGTRLFLHLVRTQMGVLVSVPNYNRCAFIAEDARALDILHNGVIDNVADCITLGTAVEYLLKGCVLDA